MLKLEVFDPPMCCGTGICGGSEDPVLVTFASDLEWLKAQGVSVSRYGLALEPVRFTDNDEVQSTICKCGNKCLPIIVLNDKIVSTERYPSREKLSALCDIAYNIDEAPPIHREENCCCGEDCDCGSSKVPAGFCSSSSCDCSNAAAEDNCTCAIETTETKPIEKIKSNTSMLTIILFILMTFIVLLALVR